MAPDRQGRGPSALPAAVQVQEAVGRALREGRPVVALESTIISHGMPYPHNIRTARAVEAAVRENGAVPATIAILEGVIHVGLTDAQLETLAAPSAVVHKCSRRDLAHAVARGLNGSTTVAATMLIARMAGIAVFVTGGIGGVHRGAEETMDVSADLLELARTPVCVVCAGVKSVLDIPKTLEVLETHGVPVATLGSDAFPAFFTADSGCPTPLRVDSPRDIAQSIHTSAALGLGGGFLVAVPIPRHLAADGAVIERATATALAEATAQRVSGSTITPFLLGRINELTGGASLQANVALILNNAAVGARIATELTALRATPVPNQATSPHTSPTHQSRL